MRTEYGFLAGDQHLTEDLAMYGTAAGTLTVPAGRTLILYGLCSANVVVEPGATAAIYGTVMGNLLNRGTAELIGTVQGGVYSKEGRFHRAPTSAVVGVLET